MKTDKATAKSREKKGSSAKNANTNNGKKSPVVVADAIAAPPSEVKKPRAGRGLANEGTIVSYEEER